MMKKRIISVLMVAILLVSMFSISVSAASSKTINLSKNRSWSSDVKVTMSKNWLGQTKSGTVRVYIANWGVNVDIRMRNGSKVIWSQNNAIKASSKTVATIYRDFSLGNDHTYYNLSFRTSKTCSVAPYVKVVPQKNCTVS